MNNIYAYGFSLYFSSEDSEGENRKVLHIAVLRGIN